MQSLESKVIDACAKSGQPNAAVMVFQQMQLRKLQPDLVVFGGIVHAFSQLGQAGPQLCLSGSLVLFARIFFPEEPTRIGFAFLPNSCAKLAAEPVLSHLSRLQMRHCG